MHSSGGMTSPRLWISVLFLSVVSTGCLGGSDPLENLHRQNGESGGIHLDPELSPGESKKLEDDLQLIRSVEIDGSQIKYFNEVFGGPDAASVNRYLSERVHWILSSKKDLDQALYPLTNGLNATVSSPQVVATNLGAAIWFSSMASGIPLVGIRVGSDLVEVRSMRAGVIQLGEAYSSDRANSFLRISTLVHEARHSDCTGGISKQDLALVRAGKDPVHKDCGHLHADCPHGHPYAGYPACDDHAWGAYAVEADFMAAVARTCTTCSARDKDLAVAVFADSASRVLDLDGLLSGTSGAPNMTSTDAIRP